MNDRPGLQFGDFTLDVSERLLLREGRPVPLTPKAFDVLATLAARPGRLVTKDELLKEVWPDSFVEESNLAYHVFAVRRALGETADGGKYVETVPKSGYRFVAPVTTVNGALRTGLPGTSPDSVGTDPQQEQASLDLGPNETESDLQSRDTSNLAPEKIANDEQASRRVSTRIKWFAVGACTAAAAAAAVLAILHKRAAPVVSEPIKVEITTAVKLTGSSAFALSPDGRRLVFAGAGADGIVRLWMRSLDVAEVRPLPGTEVALGGLVPPMFWSPDSRFVAFDSVGQLRKVDVTGGNPQTICTLPNLAVGGSWSQEDVVLVGQPDGGLIRCPASGGAATVVTRLDTSRHQSAHIFPWFLPDGRRFLYLSVSRSVPENSGIYVHSLDTPPETTAAVRLLAAGFGAAYVPDGDSYRGHLLFMREGALFAQAFDSRSLLLTGEAARIAEPVGAFLDGGFFSPSRNGALVFRPPAVPVRLTWLDRRGGVISRIGEPGQYSGLALAPGGARAIVVKDAVRTIADQDLWLVDLRSGRPSRMTFDTALEESPVWTEDGKRVMFTTGGAIGAVFEQSISGDQARQLLESPSHNLPNSISPDGQFLLYSSAGQTSTRSDIWVLPLAGARTPYPLIHRPFDQTQGQFSPDGRWVAYVSNESGRQEVMIRPFVTASTGDDGRAGESTIVSKSGGTAPRWRGDGKELFFLTLEGAAVSVTISFRPVLEVGSPVTLFQAAGTGTDWGVAADGNRFLVMAPEAPTAATSFSLIFDWQGTLNRQR